MASPDATPYIDLILRDLDPQDLVDMAVQTLQSRLPEWQPREGNQEMLIFEAVAVQIAELIYAINRLPSSVVQVLLKLNNVEYDPGQQPEAIVRFILNTSDAVTVPAGTSVRLDLLNDQDPVVFTTPVEITSIAGNTNVLIPMIGDRYTSEANGYPAGTELILNDSLVFVESVELAGPVQNGRDEETDDDYFTRGTQLFSRLTNTLVLPSQFTAFALEEVYVNRAFTVDNYDADTPSTAPGSATGHITVYVYGDGTFVSAENKDLLLQNMKDSATGNLAIHVEDPAIIPVDVEAEIYVEPGYDSSDVVQNVRNALFNYLSPETWNWQTFVRRNDIISLITNTEGVDFLNTLSVPAADLDLAAIGVLADAGTFTITVGTYA